MCVNIYFLYPLCQINACEHSRRRPRNQLTLWGVFCFSNNQQTHNLLPAVTLLHQKLSPFENENSQLSFFVAEPNNYQKLRLGLGKRTYVLFCSFSFIFFHDIVVKWYRPTWNSWTLNFDSSYLVAGVSSVLTVMIIIVVVLILVIGKNARKSDWSADNVEAVVMFKRYS